MLQQLDMRNIRRFFLDFWLFNELCKLERDSRVVYTKMALSYILDPKKQPRF